jgi:signal transduction histidine kinase
MARRSLQFRIIALSGVWIVLVLVITALLLAHYYRQHIGDHYDAHVLMHLEEIAAAASLTANGELRLSANPSDPRFDVMASGWYWEVRHGGRVLARSPSLGTAELDLSMLQIPQAATVHEVAGPGGAVLRVQTMQIETGQVGERLLLVATAPMSGVTEFISDFSRHVLISFIVLGIGLLLAVVLQVRVALQPLREIGRVVANIRGGRADRLSDDVPGDVQPLTSEINNLLEHNAELLKRARNRLGDLAHSIKNPLTVIGNEARHLDEPQRDLILGQVAHISSSVDRYLSRARASGSENVLGAHTPVRPVAEDLVFAMQRIYQDRRLDIEILGLADRSFRGEAEDLEEMLGNLLDNACKWASRRVLLRSGPSVDRCVLVVEDDGPGIPDDKLPIVLQRGEKLTDSVKGHGLGLGIVQEMAELYGGRLSLGRSELGGLTAELELPAA